MTRSPWTDEWLRAWTSFPGGVRADPWTAAFDHFTKSNEAAYQRQFSEALAKITEQSRAFFDLGQALVHHQGDGWQQAVLEYLDNLSSRLPEAQREYQGAYQSSAEGLLGASTLDLWRQFAGHETAPGQGDGHGGDGATVPGGNSFLAQVDQLLRMPGVGYTREHQESLQELSRLWLAYEKAYGEYAAYTAETSRRSLNRLREQLAESFERGEGPATIRGLYDHWVSCSEDAYAERVATQEYRRLNACMINALMAYRRQAGKIMDQWAEAANLPTRQEVDTLHRKLKETRQELSALKSALADPPVSRSAGRGPAKGATGALDRKTGGRSSRKPATRSTGKATRKRSGKTSTK